jgi:DNA ligase 1
MIEVHHKNGIFLPGCGLWLDPRGPRQLAFVSHAHSDHTGRHETTIATPATLRLMEARMGAGEGARVALDFGEAREFDSFSIRLVPAGHVLGSAQAFIKSADGTLLYTGDFKLRAGMTSEVAAYCHAETLVMETTYGLPKYIFPPEEEVFAGIVKFCVEALEEYRVPVLLGYSLGKSQEILSRLIGSGLPVMVHSTISKLAEVYRGEGISLPSFVPWNPAEAAGHVLICPPGLVGGRALGAIPQRRVAMVSGWAMDPGARHRWRCDAAFPLSDHAGYDDLLCHVQRIAPRRVLTLHGFASDFAADLRSRGYEAWALTGPNQLDLDLALPRPMLPKPPPRVMEAESGLLKFCSVALKIQRLTGRMAKCGVLADYFRQLNKAELRHAAVWLSGHAFPCSDQAPHYTGPGVVRAALLKVTGMPKMEYRQIERGLNDLGRTTEIVLEPIAGERNPSLPELASFLESLRATSGGSAKAEALAVFFREVPAIAASFVVKILSGDLRIGLKEGLLEEGLAVAFGVDAAEVREANMLEGDLGCVALMAFSGRLHERKLRLFHPVKCMLARAEPDAESVLSHFSGRLPVWVEKKFDGIRVQIHTDGSNARVFTRDLKCATGMFPEIATAAASLGRPVIFDAELLAWKNGHPLPFFTLQRRLGRSGDDLFLGAEIPVMAFVFDVLMFDGNSLLKMPLSERRSLLSQLELTAPLRIAEVFEARDATNLNSLFETARRSGHEGLMVKDPMGLYAPGRRGGGWIKLKKQFATLDVVVIEVEYGHGKRRGVLSDYTFAVRDDSTGAPVAIGKAYSGLTDPEIAALSDELLTLEVSRSGNKLTVEPQIVLEVAFDAIRESSRHVSGLALRFPRIVRIRRDKAVDEIDTASSARRLLTTCG